MANRRLRRLDLDGVQAGVVGTVAWALLALLSLVFSGFLSEHNILWWRDVAFAGVIIGLFGVRHVLRRRKRLQG